ncbi:MAG: hypothetical protein HSCHL_1755 [Hydrogenibacillus schlegelii]|uniref:Uncharacterized protein n=1 Tax=Hydrogenibacillus schlegelii TaxID=1484 RepID=A0A2T5G499_HYDSH|nr:MAG: hypothetical protein HSCHL_1755 [Hydrogenibacillus schlegelii]
MRRNWFLTLYQNDRWFFQALDDRALKAEQRCRKLFRRRSEFSGDGGMLVTIS